MWKKGVCGQYYAMYSVGGACRTRVNRVLSKKFTTPLLAEEFYESGATEDQSSSTEQVPADRSTDGGSDDDHQGSSQPSSSASITIESLDTLEVVSHEIGCIEPDQQLKFIEELLGRYCSSLNLSLPPDIYIQ